MKFLKSILYLLFGVAIISCNSHIEKLPYYNTPDFTPQFLETAPKDFHSIKPFSLLSHTGSSFTTENMKGKISVVNFFFTTCAGICPRMNFNMKSVQDTFLLDNSIQLLSFSVTPEKDSLPILAAYAKNKVVNDKRWLLLTGDKETIYTLGRNYFFVDEDMGQKKDTSEFLHTENFILVDKELHLRGIYNGLNKSSIQDLIRDVRVLKKED
jgi:protein SCO1